MDVFRVGVALALPATADLHDELARHRELQIMSSLCRRRRPRPAGAPADPHEVVRVHEDAVLAPEPLGPLPGPPQLVSSFPRCRTQAPAAPRSRAALRESTAGRAAPRCSRSVDGDRRHFAEHPVIRDRRPRRIHFEHGRAQAGLRVRLVARAHRNGEHHRRAHTRPPAKRRFHGSK